MGYIFTLLLCALTFIAHAEPEKRDPYQILGVTKSATQAQIKSAYKKNAKLLHPDRNHDQEAHAKFIELSWAYETLSDPSKRAEFDESGYIENETYEEFLERLHRENKLDYFTTLAYSKMKWQKGRPIGNTYEDAKKAFSIQSYYASEEIQRYDLTQNQLVELAKIAAENHGAIFSRDLMKKFEIDDPQRRFEVGMVAARRNSWSNVKFDIHAFRLESHPDLKFKLAKTALERSGYQIQFIPEWKFDHAQAVQLMMVAAARSNTNRPRFVELFEKIPTTEEQRLEMAKLFGVANIEYLGENFTGFRITNPKLVDQLAEHLAPRSSYVGKYVQSWGIKDYERLRKLAFLSMQAPGFFRAYEYLGKGHFELRDEDLRLVYYKHVRKRRKLSDPLRIMLSSAGMPENPYFASITNEVNEYHVERVTQWLEAYAKFAVEHPLLAPRGWLEIVRQPSYLDPDVSLALLSAAYEMSDENNDFDAISSQHILCSYLELPCKSMDFSHHSTETVNRAFNLLLQLGRSADEVPSFRGIRIDPKLLSSDLSRFLELIELVVRRGEFIANDLWMSLIKKLRLKTRGIRPENIQFLIEKTKEIFAAEEENCPQLLTEADANTPGLALPAPE